MLARAKSAFRRTATKAGSFSPRNEKANLRPSTVPWASMVRCPGWVHAADRSRRASRKEAKALARQRGRVATKQQLQRLAEDRARLIERTLVRRGIAQKRLYVVTEDPKAVRKRAPGRVEFRLLN